MKLERIETPGIAHYAYVLMDGGEAAVVDPRRDVDAYIEATKKHEATVRYIIETHRQEDFVMGSAHLAERTGATIVNGTHELFGHGDERLEDGDTLELGALVVKALHTPGHTPESMSYAVFTHTSSDEPWGVFTGDTLFFGDTGRTDLPDESKAKENAALLYDSVHQKLAPLGDGTLVFPAHGPGSVCGSGMQERPHSTIGVERKSNPVFTKDRQTFAEEKGSERIPRPPYFQHMERVNLHGGLPPVTRVVPFLDAEAFSQKVNGSVCFDLREPESYAGGHIDGTYSVWLGGLPVFGGWLADSASDVVLIAESQRDIDMAILHLQRIGIDAIRGALAGGFAAWRNQGKGLKTAGVTTPQELSQKPSKVQVLDVREPDEYAAGHIPGAQHCYVGNLEEQASELKLHKSDPLVVTCGVGHRAGVGVSILQRAGYRDVRNLLGGMKAWMALGCEVEQGEPRESARDAA